MDVMKSGCVSTIVPTMALVTSGSTAVLIMAIRELPVVGSGLLSKGTKANWVAGSIVRALEPVVDGPGVAVAAGVGVGVAGGAGVGVAVGVGVGVAGGAGVGVAVGVGVTVGVAVAVDAGV